MGPMKDTPLPRATLLPRDTPPTATDTLMHTPSKDTPPSRRSLSRMISTERDLSAPTPPLCLPRRMLSLSPSLPPSLGHSAPPSPRNQLSPLPSSKESRDLSMGSRDSRTFNSLKY